MMQTIIPMYIAVRLERGFGDNRRGVWLPLPATKKEFAAAREAIGAGYGDFVITCYNVRVPGLYRGLLLQSPLARVNFLASRLMELDEEQIIKLASIIDSDRYFTELEQFIDYTYTHDRYTLLFGVTSADALGWQVLQGEGFATVPSGLKECIDPYTLGMNIARKQDGQFTALGYLTSENDWSTAPRKRRVPVILNLTGVVGEDLYGDGEGGRLFEYEAEDGGDE